RGVRSIEASAGTGKTFTLATLVVRLVLERALPVERILAVTFTEAATQELRARVRRRLVLAADVAAGIVPGDGSPDAELTARLLQAHLSASGEPADAVARRLRAAADGIDQAAVFTIHGFCARGLREAVAADLWRAHARDAEGVADLEALWPGGPQALAADLPALVRQPRLRPQPADMPPQDPQPRLDAAARALVEAGLAHGDALRTALLAAVEAKVLNGNSYRAAWIGELFDQLQRWCRAGRSEVPFEHPKLAQLHRATLLKCTSKAGAGKTPDSPLCDAVQAYAAALAAVEAFREARRVALLHRL